MNKINVTIEGISPLLMNNIAGANLEGGARLRTKKVDKAKEAEKSAYWMKVGKKKMLCVPQRCLYAMIVKAGNHVKISGKYAGSILAGAINVEPENISLGTNKYDVDIRPVVIQRARVLKARPKLNEWKLTFDIVYDEDFIGEDALKKILEIAGVRVGLLDFRPAKKGPFGKFKVTKWEVS